MKHSILLALLCAGVVSTTTNAQSVNREKYPDYSSEIKPDFSLLKSNIGGPVAKTLGTGTEEALPDHVDNSRFKYFPPVFNQDAGSCGSASRICYMFTHEINAYRGADAQLLSNQYPSHFVWLLTFGNSGKEDFAIRVGVPSAEVYGGRTYSRLFGYQEASDPNFGWMQGYDKWYAGMWNRMESTGNFPISVESEEGRNAVKRWLYNHNGDTDFHCGGIVGIGVASDGDWQPIPSTPTNDEIGVTGMKYVKKWGTQVDHALTIVGYDDRIEFDLNNNGIKGEESADEKGAWIVVNSWGQGWCNNGFVYCPYAHAVPAFNKDGSCSRDFYRPEIYRVRKNYRPLRTIKIKMDYSHRSELYLSAGVSSNLEATMPEKSIAFDHFKFAGDGSNGNTRPAPAVPMLGRWADGKLHHEPMEFGYDLTDLSASFDKNMPLKYFFIVETRGWAIGRGKIYNASIIDYEFQKSGIETPFDINGEGVEIKNQGNKTIISTIVYGESYYAPRNLSLADSQLTWEAPLRSVHPVKGYKIYRDGKLLAEVAKNQQNYQLTETVANATYALSAIYEDGTESHMIKVNSPIELPGRNQVINLRHSGFSIPNVFQNKFNEVTLEYWIKPSSVESWNQSGGPGWGTFMFHTNSNGAFTVGWNTGAERIDTPAGTLQQSTWTHIAITVNKNTMKVYVNGVEKKSLTSSTYSGLGGFGNLNFRCNGSGDDQNARYDEIRIWNYAKSAQEIKDNYKVEYSGNILPKGLIAYIKGNTIDVDGKTMLQEYISGNHATLLNNNYNQTIDTRLKFEDSKEAMSLDIIQPKSEIYQGLPAEFSTTHSNTINKLLWTAEGAGAKNLSIANPSFIFKNAGEQKVTVVGSNAKGVTIEKSCIVNVLATPAIDATFTATKTNVPAGETVTFVASKPMLGYIYEWSMPGADLTSTRSINATTTYSAKGEYEVSLKVTSPDGKSASTSQKITIVEVAPEAEFNIAPEVIVKNETTFLNDNSKFTPNKWQWFLHSAKNNIIVNGQNSSLTPQHPGVYDVTLTVKNDSGADHITKKRALIVCNADSKNGLNFSKGFVELAKNPFEADKHHATIEWWMNPRTIMNYCNGFGEENKVELKTTDLGSMLIKIGSATAESKSDYVISGEWHHYAVTYSYGTVKFYRDGVEFNTSRVNQSTIPSIKTFRIGLNKAPMDCQMDEFRIWNKVLTTAQIQEYANAPIADIENAVKDNNLAVYYDFNQSGGDVIDRTSNKNNGSRHDFGPDGDSWSLSKGVFSLNFEKAAADENVTATYLKNYKTPFKTDGDKLVNPVQKPRFAAIADWTLENTSVHNNTITGVHVDKNKGSNFTFTTSWDGFESSLTDHKAFQTVTLPAGCYQFIASYGQNESNCGNSYIAVAEGKTLPNSSDMGKALVSAEMLTGYSTEQNTVFFSLSEETEVSLGLVINMAGRSCCTIDNFKLMKVACEEINADGANGYDLTVDATGYSSLYLPYPTVVPENATAYVAKAIDGDQVVLEPLASGIVPAKTGVVIAAQAGEYHFAPSVTTVAANSILTGVLEETAVDNSKRYFQLDAQKEPGFYLYNASSLEANRAYLVTDANDTHESYKLNIVPVGIDQIEAESTPSKVYDLSGRRVSEPTKGLYIINGKKVFVK